MLTCRRTSAPTRCAVASPVSPPMSATTSRPSAAWNARRQEPACALSPSPNGSHSALALLWPRLLAQFERQQQAQPSHCCSVYVVGRDVACDISGQTLCYGWDFTLGMGMPVSAAIPLPDLALALQEAKHLDQLPPVVPWGKAPIDHSGRN